MYIVYILYSHRCARRYIGQTDDLDQQLVQHSNSGGQASEFSRNCPGPWVLIHSERFESQMEASQREKWLKSEIGSAWIDENVPIPK